MSSARVRPGPARLAITALWAAAASTPVGAQTLALGTEELLVASTTHASNQRPRLVFTADGVKHLAWIAGPSFGAEGVFLISAPSAAAAYGSPIMLSNAMDGVRYGIGDGLELDVRDSYVLASWEGTDFDNRPMWFALSSSYGVLWDAAVRADPDTLEERAYTNGTVFSDGRVAQIWITYDAATGDPSHEFRAQDNLGVFGPPTDPAAASPDVPCECCTADPIVLDDGTILVAYRNNENNRRRMYVSRSTDGGATFPSTVRVDQGPTIFFACPGSPPSITAQGQDVLVAWGKVGGSPQIFHTLTARSTDGGVTFAPQTQVDDSDGTQAAGYPTVARVGDLAVTVWTAKDPATNQYEVWSGTSTDGGSTWGPEQQLTGDGLSAFVRHPAVAISPTLDVEIAWTDERNGTEKVYRLGGTLDVTGVAAIDGSGARGVGSPNPFRTSTTVSFSPGIGNPTRLVIVDVAGRVVRTLPGTRVFSWDGRDANGRPAPAGVYFARRETSRDRATRLVRLR